MPQSLVSVSVCVYLQIRWRLGSQQGLEKVCHTVAITACIVVNSLNLISGRHVIWKAACNLLAAVYFLEFVFNAQFVRVWLVIIFSNISLSLITVSKYTRTQKYIKYYVALIFLIFFTKLLWPRYLKIIQNSADLNLGLPPKMNIKKKA